MSLYTMTFEDSDSSSSPKTASQSLTAPSSDSTPPTAESSESEISDLPDSTPISEPASLTNRRDVVVRFSSSGSDDEIAHIETSYAPDPTPPAEPPPEPVPLEVEVKIPNIGFGGVSDSHEIARLKTQIQRLPNSGPPGDLIPYRMFRTQKMTLKGQRTKFSLCRDGKLILFSKIKARATTEIVYISREKKDFHFSSPSFEAALLAGNGFRSFSLRLRNQFGPEMMILRFECAMLEYAPRVVRAMLFNQPVGVPDELVSRAPAVTAAGTWILDLNGRIGKRSIKNCVLTDRKGKEFMSVMKLKKSEFVVESHPAMSELCVFALGISSCLCKM
jgi:hypothetical protein